MAGEWDQVRLGDLSEVITKGTTPTSLGFRFTDTGINFVKSESVTFDGWIDRSKFARIDAETHSALKRSQLKEGDVLFSMAGVYLGKTAVVPKDILPANTNQAVGIVRLDQSRAHPRFIDYFLRNPSYNLFLNNLVSQSAQPNLNLTEIRNLPIALPPLAEQKAITAVLGALDDKIELNRRMNATLEAMARALFQSWFVDFDPVRAKLDGRQPVGLDQATAALFPDSFQDSELGHIPKGWRVTTVAKTCQAIFSGGTPSTQNAAYWGGDIPWLSSGETRSAFIIKTEKTITMAGVENSSTRIARAGCTVIAGAGQGHTRGQTSLLTFESYINQSVVALAANPTVSSDLFLFFDLARRYEEFRQLSDSHSSRGSLTTKLLAGVKCVLPAYGLVTTFDQAVRPLAVQITANLHQSRTLATLRDTLLPKLLSGELSVERLESKLGAAA